MENLLSCGVDRDRAEGSRAQTTTVLFRPGKSYTGLRWFWKTANYMPKHLITQRMYDLTGRLQDSTDELLAVYYFSLSVMG